MGAKSVQCHLKLRIAFLMTIGKMLKLMQVLKCYIKQFGEESGTIASGPRRCKNDDFRVFLTMYVLSVLHFLHFCNCVTGAKDWVLDNDPSSCADLRKAKVFSASGQPLNQQFQWKLIERILHNPKSTILHNPQSITQRKIYKKLV